MITRMAVVEKDESGDVQGGMVFLHPKGSDIVIYQKWEYRCSGNVYGPMLPDPIGSEGLLAYFLENWQDKAEPFEEPVHYEIDSESITADYR